MKTRLRARRTTWPGARGRGMHGPPARGKKGREATWRGRAAGGALYIYSTRFSTRAAAFRAHGATWSTKKGALPDAQTQQTLAEMERATA